MSPTEFFGGAAGSNVDVSARPDELPRVRGDTSARHLAPRQPLRVGLDLQVGGVLFGEHRP